MLVVGKTSKSGSFGSTFSTKATLGLRSLREEYSRPQHRKDIPRNLGLIQERAAHLSMDVAGWEEARKLPRFKHLFNSFDELPPAVFTAALELTSTETLNGRSLPYDTDVLVLRDNLVAAYKPLVWRIRQLLSNDIDELPAHLVAELVSAWKSWECAWLRNREVHAVEALQPLAKAILALEPMLLSHHKEQLLPWPRVQHQKVVTLRCLEGFMHALGDLAANVLPSPQRELDRDPRLMMLMDHVLSLHGAEQVESCISGLSKTPGVFFPAQQLNGSVPPLLAPMPKKGIGACQQNDAKDMTLDAYAFRLLGASVGDSLAAQQQTLTPSPNNPKRGGVGRFCNLDSPHKIVSNASSVGESILSQQAAMHAVELLAAFEDVKDLLISLKSTLEYIDPALDHDEKLTFRLRRFERAYRKAKRLFFEPDNLA